MSTTLLPRLANLFLQLPNIFSNVSITDFQVSIFFEIAPTGNPRQGHGRATTLHFSKEEAGTKKESRKLIPIKLLLFENFTLRPKIN